MDKTPLAIRLKELRLQKGMSQEFLADESGLSLRTIQRIENAESNPTGESIKRLAFGLNVSPDELIDWSIKEDRNYLVYLNLSALAYLVFPLLGILIPFILWTSKKGKIKHIDQLGRALINYQITWTLFLFIIPILLFILTKTGIIHGTSLSTILISTLLLYGINLISILINTVKISNGKNSKYIPKIRFLK